MLMIENYKVWLCHIVSLIYNQYDKTMSVFVKFNKKCVLRFFFSKLYIVNKLIHMYMYKHGIIEIRQIYDKVQLIE